MVRNVEKLIKIEHPRKIPKMVVNTIEVIPLTHKLDLVNIEPYSEPKTIINIDLELDQLEESDE